MQERGKLLESLIKIRQALNPKPEQKPVPGTRLGENAPDVTLSPDYKAINGKKQDK